MAKREAIERFREKTKPLESGCIEWQGARDKDGYGLFWFNDRLVGAHKWAWEREKGPVPEGYQVCHDCDYPACVNTDHMFTGTAKDNAEDREKKGRGNQATGENHGSAVLTRPIVDAIRREYQPGVVGYMRLGKKYGVNPGTVRHIVKFEIWK